VTNRAVSTGLGREGLIPSRPEAPAPPPRWRAPGLGGGDVQRCHRLLGALLGEGAALGWEQGASVVYPISRSLIPGCFAEGGGRLWGQPGFVCPSLSLSLRPHPGLLPDRSLSCRVGKATEAARVACERSPDCEGRGLSENPTTASPRRVMGVEKDPEGRGAGEAGGRAAGLPAPPDKSRGSPAGPECGGGPRGFRASFPSCESGPAPSAARAASSTCLCCSLVLAETLWRR
jgi:hypothetical protein